MFGRPIYLGMLYKLLKLRAATPLKGRGRGGGLDSAMSLARQECLVIEDNTDPTPNPSPTREGRDGAPLTNK